MSKSNVSQEFEIVKGESVRTIASHLEEKNLIKSELVFRLLVTQNKLTIQAGIYQLSPSQSPMSIALSLTKGLALDSKLTIPEGYRSEQIAEAVGIPTQEFLISAKGLEGQLFPDTYFVKEVITADVLVTLLHDNFLKKVGNIDQATLTLASLVERETKGDTEKPIVAGILKKRLAANWALELDATIQYFLGKPGAWWPNTTLADRKLASPYNTYLHLGLPPTPICNPGLASISSARSPQDSTYWFYLHDDKGGIHYGATLAEHNANIAKYIR
ncbi:MAG: endolytic transglycosylase MltG [bacterium]